MLRHLRPRSTLTLILTAFGVVTLPLFIALGVAGLYVDRLAAQGETSVQSAARAVQASIRLSEALNGMERRARQYLLLGEDGMLESYKDYHMSFQDNVNELAELMADTSERAVVRAIGTREMALHNQLIAEDARDALDQETVAAAFTQLRDRAAEIRSGSRELIATEISRMQGTASTAKAWLLWLGAALIPLTLASSAVFTALISRPVRRLDHAIRQLGDSGFDEPIAITGPEDLRALGDRLEWLRQRLNQLESEKARFLRHVSHELKTPLTAIRESGELLENETVGSLNNDQREIAGILNDSGRRLQGLIENLLDFARTNSHQRPLAMGDVDMAELARAVLRDHRPEIRAKGLAIRTHLSACWVRGDEDKLKTVVDNIVSNAVKFSPNGGQLTVTALANRDWAVLSIADQGPGIPAAERERIFDAFVQGGADSGSEVKGSGLGLSIAREYVRAHGGHINISDAEDGGNRVRIDLPRQLHSQD